ncbi:MAG: ParA family protein, partial [Thermomicrobiales bacterium]
FNHNGATPQTSSTPNVAAALAENRRRVLMADLDPPASLTLAVGADIASMDGSVYDVLLDESVEVQSVITGTTIGSVELLPAHPDLAAAELELLNELERERVLAHRLETLDLSAWDYVLIDSPPALNIISINILVAADALIIPIEPHPLSLMVLKRLFETLAKIRRLNPDLEILGFLPTKVHSNSRLATDMLTSLEEQFPDLPLLPQIPLSVRSAESAAERTSVLAYMPRSPVAAAYRSVATWIDEDERDGAVPGSILLTTEELHV